jgi:hypothetical protein
VLEAILRLSDRPIYRGSITSYPAVVSVSLTEIFAIFSRLKIILPRYFITQRSCLIQNSKKSINIILLI